MGINSPNFCLLLDLENDDDDDDDDNGKYRSLQYLFIMDEIFLPV